MFKSEVASKLNIEYDDVIIMGSSKAGFSLKPDKDNRENINLIILNIMYLMEV